MNVAMDMMLGVYPAIVSVSIVFVMFAYWLALRARNRPRQRAFFVEFFYWFTNPVVELLVRLGVTPNTITATSLVFSSLAGLALSQGLFFTTLFILLFGASCDVLDGQVARRTDTQSRSGAFLDSFIDRLSEGALLIGAAWYGDGGWLTLVAFVAMVSGFSISYARARGESLGVDAKVGLMQRPARMVFLLFLFLGVALGSFGGWSVVQVHRVLTAGLVVLSALSIYTSIQRVTYIMNQLREPQVTSGGPENSPA